MGRGRRDHGQFTVFHFMREGQVVSDNTLPKENGIAPLDVEIGKQALPTLSR
jgi:hypothetical protein